jgi:hypothetical protein
MKNENKILNLKFDKGATNFTVGAATGEVAVHSTCSEDWEAYDVWDVGRWDSSCNRRASGAS